MFRGPSRLTDVTVSDGVWRLSRLGRAWRSCDARRPWLVPGFVRKQDAATAAVASIEDAAECGERADALVSGVLGRVMRQRRSIAAALDPADFGIARALLCGSRGLHRPLARLPSRTTVADGCCVRQPGEAISCSPGYVSIGAVSASSSP